MKVLFACLLLVAATQAVDWAKVRPVYRTKPVLKREPAGKIIGGDFAVSGQFPYQVGLFLDGSGFCGGSLIANDVVLTAAHCADDVSRFEIHLGALNIYDESEPMRLTVWSSDGVPHREYNSNSLNNDIALIRLVSPVTGPGFEPIRLPSYSMAGETFVGERARVSGWGRTAESASISPDLKFADVTIMTNEECHRYFGNDINDLKICIETNGGTEGVCNGDSGGPMVITELDGIPTEIGIVSFGSSLGCTSGWPAVFTRVTEYVDWIATNGNVTIRP